MRQDAEDPLFWNHCCLGEVLVDELVTRSARGGIHTPAA